MYTYARGDLLDEFLWWEWSLYILLFDAFYPFCWLFQFYSLIVSWLLLKSFCIYVLMVICVLLYKKDVSYITNNDHIDNEYS